MMRDVALSCGFNIVAGDTDSLFLTGGNEDALNDLIILCKEKIGVDVEHGETFAKALIIKKKHYIGVTTDGKVKAVGMEGKKNDRPAWINRAFEQFLEDFKAGIDPTIKIRAAINDLENKRVDSELLKIRVQLTRNPEDYAVNNPNKKIGTLLGARAGEVIAYFKTDDKKEIASVKPEDIGIAKYKQMLKTALQDALEIMGYGMAEEIESEIFGLTRKPKRKRSPKRQDP
jgi:DNA polymerase elongation subunit (family B)